MTPEIQCFVRGPGRTVTVDGLLPSDPVAFLMTEAGRKLKLGTRCDDAWFTLGGRPLDLACRLSAAGINNGATVHLAFRGRGGGCMASKASIPELFAINQLRDSLAAARAEPELLSAQDRMEAVLICTEWQQVLAAPSGAAVSSDQTHMRCHVEGDGMQAKRGRTAAAAQPEAMRQLRASLLAVRAMSDFPGAMSPVERKEASQMLTQWQQVLAVLEVEVGDPPATGSTASDGAAAPHNREYTRASDARQYSGGIADQRKLEGGLWPSGIVEEEAEEEGGEGGKAEEKAPSLLKHTSNGALVMASFPTAKSGSEDAYVMRHAGSLSDTLNDALVAAIRSQPDDPVSFIARWLVAAEPTPTEQHAHSATPVDEVGEESVPERVSISVLRRDLKRAQQEVYLAQMTLTQLLPDSRTRRRGGHLLTLGELIGQRPSHHWELEWLPLRTEHKGLNCQDLDANSVETVEQLSRSFHRSISMLQERGWHPEHAQAYAVLSTCRNALGRALREKDGCYAASVYALSEALYLRHSEQGLIQAATANHSCSPLLYFFRSGPYSLTEAEPAWRWLEEPDATGFRGLTSHAMTRVMRRPVCFAEGGFVYRVTHGINHFEDIDTACDVVCFESASDDELGAHSAIMLDSEEVGVFPPNTLFSLKRIEAPGTWEAPNGLYPRQRLLVVTATYHSPTLGADGSAGGGKLCGDATVLSYDNREGFVRGLDDIIAKPSLSMSDEFDRELSWSDWRGRTYHLRQEWGYVRGVASIKEDCTPGVRDANNVGKTPEQFLSEVNTHIRSRRLEVPQWVQWVQWV